MTEASGTRRIVPRPVIREESRKRREDILKEAVLRHLLTRTFPDDRDLCRLALWRMLGEPAECAFLFVFDSRRRCIRTERICRNGVRMTDSYPEHIRNILIESRGSSFMLAHNHKGGPLAPSPDDIHLTLSIRKMASEIQPAAVVFLGHFITDGTHVGRIVL